MAKLRVIEALFFLAILYLPRRSNALLTKPLLVQRLGKLRSAPTSLATTDSPPTSFIDCVHQAAISTAKALSDGYKLIEVEFPPLPLDYLEDSSSSAKEISNANTKWAVEFAARFSGKKRVSIIFPDQPELDDALLYLASTGYPAQLPNITLASTRADSIRNAGSVDEIISSILGAVLGGKVEKIDSTDMYIAIITSTQELQDLDKLHALDPDAPIIFFNLRLDVLRGDLGLPFFPTREFHHRFLSQIKPSFFMRSRSFATTLSKPPYVLNYSGLQFRAYPGPYQSILNAGNGKSRLVQNCSYRPSNKEFRDHLTSALRVPGISISELKTTGNLVWWEKEQNKDQSTNWRT